MQRILVVDDSEATRMMIRGILEGLGVEVLEAANGREALEMIDSHQIPEAILLDWYMPEMDGIECLRRLREDPRLADTKVIMVTSATEFDRIQQALDEGADEYVMKPFDSFILSGKLERLGVFTPSRG
ncbi:MAG: PleD family two-component system response regulator [Planctomycetota bacterium]